MSAEQVSELLSQAQSAFGSGQYVQALDLADQALALDPGSGEAHLVRAMTLSRTGQSELATAAFRASMNAMPSSAEPQFQMAAHFESNGMKREALETARRALDADPAHAGAREMISRIEAELGMGAPPTVEAPPQEFGAQSPYQPPQAAGAPQGGYYRPGYESFDGRIHQVAFVERMGKNWDTIGMVLAIIQGLMLLYTVGYYVVNWDAMMEIIRTGSQPPATPAWQWVLSVISLINTFGSIFWVATDIADRRGNWLWLVCFLCTCCCAPVQLIYFLAGRKN